MKNGGFFARSSLHAIDVSFPKNRTNTGRKPVRYFYGALVQKFWRFLDFTHANGYNSSVISTTVSIYLLVVLRNSL